MPRDLPRSLASPTDLPSFDLGLQGGRSVGIAPSAPRIVCRFVAGMADDRLRVEGSTATFILIKPSKQRGQFMAIDLKALSPKELQALIAGANAQMQEAHSNQVRTVREKIDAVLKSAGLTINEVYPTRGGKKAASKKGVVAPKYRNPDNTSETWSGRGRQPVWFSEALKKRGVTAESLLIGGASVRKAAPAKKAAAKKVKRAPVKKA